MSKDQVIQWLLDSDPSIRWQVLQDILHATSEVVAEERAKITTEGWAKQILTEQKSTGAWDPENRFPEMVTLGKLHLLYEMGIDPFSDEVKQAISKVQENVMWLMNISKEELPKDEDISWWHNPFFDGEVEPCINGRVLLVGAYFGVDVQPLVERLLSEQMKDGGWNCDQAIGSARSSFHTTINVLEGLLEFERVTGKSDKVTNARERGHQYLLERQLFKRLSTGKAIEKDGKGGPLWTQFAFPAGWHYDILRGINYFRKAGVTPDPRMAEAIDIIQSKRNDDGKWELDIMHTDVSIADTGETVGKPSYWNTLRAMQVLEWYFG